MQEAGPPGWGNLRNRDNRIYQTGQKAALANPCLKTIKEIRRKCIRASEMAA
jgi:hypothetical protein